MFIDRSKLEAYLFVVKNAKNEHVKKEVLFILANLALNRSNVVAFLQEETFTSVVQNAFLEGREQMRKEVVLVFGNMLTQMDEGTVDAFFNRNIIDLLLNFLLADDFAVE